MLFKMVTGLCDVDGAAMYIYMPPPVMERIVHNRRWQCKIELCPA